MTPLLIILSIVLLAWRYRQVLGLSQRWDRHARPHADDLAAKLGWTNRQSTNGPSSTSPAPPVRIVTQRRSFVPNLDTSRLSVSLAAGAAVAFVVIALDLQDYSLLAFLVGMLIGPFLGGAYLRSRWWLLVAPIVAVVAGAGGELGLLMVTLPVVAIAYAGIRTDIVAIIARWNAEPEES